MSLLLTRRGVVPVLYDISEEEIADVISEAPPKQVERLTDWQLRARAVNTILRRRASDAKEEAVSRSPSPNSRPNR